MQRVDIQKRVNTDSEFLQLFPAQVATAHGLELLHDACKLLIPVQV